VVSKSQRRERAETQQPGLVFNNFKPWLESGIFKCIFWFKDSFFGGRGLGLSERMNRDLLNGLIPDF
jgi:hypothetical protein